MDLYSLKNKQLLQVESNPFDLEKDIQTIVENNTQELFNLQLVSSEFSVGGFRLDSLCFDEVNKSFVVVEYKKNKSYSVIDQGYSYLSLMLNNKSDFILEYNENNKDTLKRGDIDWSQSRIIFISPSFNTYQKNSVNFKDVPFELWEIKRFSNNIISLNQHLPSSSESIQKIGENKNSVIKSVSREVKVYDEDFHYNSVSDKTKTLFFKLKEELLSFDDISIDSKKHYISFKKNNVIVCYSILRKEHLFIEIVKGNLKTDGSKSKGFFTLDDPKKVSKILNFKYKDGMKREYYQIKLSNLDHIGYCLLLIKQKYDTLV